MAPTYRGKFKRPRIGRRPNGSHNWKRLAAIAATPILEAIQPGSSVAYHAAMRASGSGSRRGSGPMSVSQLGSGGATRGSSRPLVTRKLRSTTGRLTGKYRRLRGGNKKRSLNFMMAKKGVSFVTEAQDQVTDDQCVYIGHTTALYQEWAKYSCFALLKHMCDLNNIPINDWTAASVFGSADVFVLEWKSTINSAPTSTSIQLTPADVLSFYATADAIWTRLVYGIVNGGSFNVRSVVMAFGWRRGGLLNQPGVNYINLYDADFTFLAKSALKIQNRTVTTVADNEADDVNNCPINGKVYEAYSNAIYPKSNTTFPVPSRITGVVSEGAGSRTSLHEPPPAYHFHNVKKSQKVSISPGGIKTSILDTYKKFNLTTFYRMLASLYNIDDSIHQVYFGKVRFFALERVIGRLSGTESPVTCVYEVNSKLQVVMNAPQKNYCAPIV